MDYYEGASVLYAILGRRAPEDAGSFLLFDPNIVEKRIVLQAMNEALQEIHTKAPDEFFSARVGGILRGKRTAQATFLSTSPTINQPSEIQVVGTIDNFIHGASAFYNDSRGEVYTNLYMIDDDEYPVNPTNPLVFRMRLTEPSVDVPPGNDVRDITYYGDALGLPIGYQSVIGPVVINGKYPLAPVTGETESRYINNRWAFIDHDDDYGFYQNHGFQMNQLDTVPKEGMPSRYYIDNNYFPKDLNAESFDPAEQNHMRNFLKVRPLPQEDMSVSFKIKLGPPKITLDMIETQAAGDQILRMPADYVESIFLPVAKYRLSFFVQFSAVNRTINDTTTTSTRTRAENTQAALFSQYQEALEILRSLKPQRDRSIQMVLA